MNILHSLLEGNSPHKKGTPAYKKHMAAMHAESEEGTADMNEMKEVQTSVGIMVANDDGTPVSEKDYYRWTMKTDKNPPKANIISQRYQIYLQDFKQYAMGESMNEISDFKRRELEYELRHEEPNRDPKKRRPYRTPQEKIRDAKKRYSKAVGVMKGNTDEGIEEAEGDKCEICNGRGKIDYHSEDGPSKCQKCNGKGVQAWKPEPVNWGKVKEDEVTKDVIGHVDNEADMLRKELFKMGKYSVELYKMLDQLPEGDFPHWWQAKIVKAGEYLSSAKHYLDGELNSPEEESPLDTDQEQELHVINPSGV